MQRWLRWIAFTRKADPEMCRVFLDWSVLNEVMSGDMTFRFKKESLK